MDGPNQIGDWQKISDLGSGAFGIVTLWKNNANENFIAIKKCKFRTSQMLSAKQKERWNNEVEKIKLINHPNIIQFKSIPSELETELLKHNPTKLPLLPMEYCTKGNLRHILCKPKNISGLQEQDVRDILEDIASGLHHLHRLKITHRDIKPDNIVLKHCDDRKSNTKYKIIDLGFAKDINDTVVSFVGTLHYLAPEIFENIQYNNSVDYWSMGILIFEVICGVLPFLPQLTPVERFDKIKEKGLDDICIYFSYSGNVTFSKEIKKEHFISNCLKQDIEVWLRHVFQFDQEKRCQNFPNNVKVFEYIQNVLKKKMVKVFSVHKLEFYSYEINESTLFGTLKSWISRDIKSNKDDFILLLNEKCCQINDSTIILDVLIDNYNIYVVKKNVFVSDDLQFNCPKLIKELFKSVKKFERKHTKSLYAQAIFYITTEKNLIENFKICFKLYYENLKSLTEVVSVSSQETSKQFKKIILKIEEYNDTKKNNICDKDLKNNKTYVEYLIQFQRLLSSFERNVEHFRMLKKNIVLLENRQKALDQVRPIIESIINSCDLNKPYTSIVALWDNTRKIQAENHCFFQNINDIVLETIKIKDKLLFNKKFKNYLGAISIVYSLSYTLKSWIYQFDNYLFDLFKSLEHSEKLYQNIVFQASKEKQEREITSNNYFGENLKSELFSLPPSYLFSENESLRNKFEKILKKSILDHHAYKEAVNPYLLS